MSLNQSERLFLGDKLGLHVFCYDAPFHRALFIGCLVDELEICHSLAAIGPAYFLALGLEHGHSPFSNEGVLIVDQVERYTSFCQIKCL